MHYFTDKQTGTDNEENYGLTDMESMWIYENDMWTVDSKLIWEWSLQ